MGEDEEEEERNDMGVFLYSLALIFMLYNLNDDLKDRSLESTQHTQESFELKSLTPSSRSRQRATKSVFVKFLRRFAARLMSFFRDAKSPRSSR